MYRKKSRDKSAMKIKKIIVLSYFFPEISKKKKKGQVNSFPKFNGYFGGDNLLPMRYNIHIFKKLTAFALVQK